MIFSSDRPIYLNKIFLTILLLGLVFTHVSVALAEVPEQAPKTYLTGQPANVTVQELGGLISRPLRLLAQKNNQLRGEGFMKVYALGVSAGDELAMELTVRSPGVRATVYRVHQEPGAPRFLTMPASHYFDRIKIEHYGERIKPFTEDYLILVFEKTDSPDEKDVSVRYFEDRVRKLEIVSYNTNLFFSALKFKVKEFSDNDQVTFFEKDAQPLIDRLTHPQQIVLLRFWNAGKR